MNGLGVSCFTLYTEDVWHPNYYIPHEVDTELFYPEPMYAGPTPGYCQRVIQDLQGRDATPPGGPRLLGQYFEDASFAPVAGVPTAATHYQSRAPLFDGFRRRERVASMAAFAPAAPAVGGATTPELLFLHFRSPTTLDGELWGALCALAGEIFATLDEEIRHREATWHPAMRRTMRAQASVASLINQSLLKNTAGTPDRLFEQLLDSLLAALRHDEDEHLIASIYTFDASDGELDLCCRCQRGTRGDPQREQQACYGPECTITLLTALSARSHLLNYVEALDEVSVTLTARQADMLRGRLSAPTFTVEPPRGRSSPPRLVLNRTELVRELAGRYGLAYEEAREQIIKFKGFRGVYRDGIVPLMDARAGVAPEWALLKGGFPQVYARLCQRAIMKYADVFGTLDSEWHRPCSEVCVPMMAAGRSVGCLNIESPKPDRFNPSVLNVLVSLCAVVGQALAQESTISMLDSVQRAAEAIYMHAPSPKEALVRGRLDELARTAARTVLCQRLEVLVPDEARTPPRYQAIASTRPPGDASGAWRTDSGEYWTARLVESGSGARRGTVLSIAEEGGTGRVVGGCDLVDDPAKGVLGVSKVPIALGDVPEAMRCASGWGEGASQLVGVRLLDRHGVASSALGILWCAFRAHVIHVPGTRPPAGLRGAADDSLAHLLSVADRCALVPIAWHSSLMEAERRFAFWNHGHPSEFLFAANAAIGEFLLNNSSIGPLLAAQRKIEYVLERETIIEHASDRVSADMVREDVADLAHVGNLHKIVDECWELASQMMPRLDSALVNDVDPALAVHTSIKHLREVLVLILANCSRHGVGDGASDSVRVRVTCAEVEPGPDLLELEIGDHGRGFIAAASPAPRLDVDARRPRHGVRTIEKFGFALSGRRPRSGNYPDGGAWWRVYVPGSRTPRPGPAARRS